MLLSRKWVAELLARWANQANDHVAIVSEMHKAEVARLEARAQYLERELVAQRDDHSAAIDAWTAIEGHLNEQIGERNVRIAGCETRNRDLQQQVTVAQNNFEWARLRLNQVEVERAELIRRLIDVRLPVLELTHDMGPAATPKVERTPQEDAVSDLMQGLGLTQGIFEDLGDDAAAREGVSLNEDGSLRN